MSYDFQQINKIIIPNKETAYGYIATLVSG